MDGLPTWAWLSVAAAVLLSPVFGFLTAILAEVLICLVKEGGVPALLALVAAGLIARIIFNKVGARRRAGRLARDQA